MTSRQLKARCFVNAPFSYLEQNLDRFVAEGIQPEIGLEGEALYRRSLDEFKRVADRLLTAGLSCTLHAPFFELSIGALDPHIRQVSRDKMRRAFALIPLFQPRSIVCHLGFEENKHGYKEKEWFRYALDGWRELLDLAAAHDTPLMLENTYETGPGQHKKILAALASPYARFCFDVGHVLAFAKNRWQDWLPELEPWLGQLHLHDNHGGHDAHLAIGQGIFDFRGLFDYMKQRHLSPLLTMEPHHEGGVEASFAALAKLV
ncbi:MAG: sugar phosphate isomerase/epimerase family protein [Thermodesulfobacteriota bacterium]